LGIHATALIDPEAEIDSTATIGRYVVIDGPVRIEAGTVVDPFAVISGFTQIGKNCRIHSGAKIGGVPQDVAYTGDKSFCRVGDGTIVREGATIHRGTVAGSSTIVGANCLIMVNAHVGHNCELADRVILVNGALLGGYVTIGARAIVSGNSAIHQFVRVGPLAMIGGMAKVVQDIPPFVMVGRAGRCTAVNAIGMKRAQLTPVDRADVRKAFGLLYRSGLSLADAIARLHEEVQTDAGRQFLAFLTAPSKRGITCATERE